MIAILDTSHRDALSDLLIEAVAGGASVSFMHPITRETADGFWDRALAAAARDERVVLGAFDGEALVGTVTLLLDCPDNQPHRAEIAKMITRLSHRGRGIATALLREAEGLAVERSRTLLVLDTATDGGASPSHWDADDVLIRGRAISSRSPSHSVRHGACRRSQG